MLRGVPFRVATSTPPPSTASPQRTARAARPCSSAPLARSGAASASNAFEKPPRSGRDGTCRPSKSS